MASINVQKFEPYKPPLSIWKLIKDTVPSKELSYIKLFIGESSIEYCLDLRNELEVLLDIWKEISDRAEPPIVTKNGLSNILPDPPQLKEMLIKEIQMLAKEIRQKNATKENELGTGEEKVIQYALLAHKERPKTPLRKNSSDLSISSPLKLRQVQKNISVTGIEAVSEMLKDAMQKECEQLEKDIEFLQQCIEEEHEIAMSRPNSPIQEPSIAQLQHARRILESHALSNSMLQSSNQADLPTPVAFKRPTPPSPQRVQLEPIDVSNPITNLSSNLHILDLTQTDSDSWIEPSWTKCMSDAYPPSTADSGVSSRPGTCELSALQERRKHLPLAQGFLSDHNLDVLKTEELSSNDVGYLTGSSLDFSSVDKPSNPEQAVVKRNSYSSKNQIHSNDQISPHPPKDNSFKLSRKYVSARKLSRKLVKTKQ